MSENTEKEVRTYEDSFNAKFSNGRELPIIQHFVISKDAYNNLPTHDMDLMGVIMIEIAKSFLSCFVPDSEPTLSLEQYNEYPSLGHMKVIPLQSYNPDLMTCFSVEYIKDKETLALREFMQYQSDKIPDRVLDLINDNEEERGSVVAYIKYGDV